MNKLEQLIKELCPNGVEYKKLGDIATDVFRGAGITRNQVTEEGTPCVRYGEIYTTYGIYFDTCVSHTDESTIQSKKYFEYGDILFAITGESVEDIAKSTAYVGHEKCLAGGDIVVLKHNQNPKYLSYALSTTTAQMQKSKGKVKSKVVHSSVPSIKDIIIPVPPLEVQAEIVKILDNFTELTAVLTAELTARKKQYEYYRNLMLDFGAHGEKTGDCEWRTIKLGDIGRISMCKRIMKSETTPDGDIPFYKIGTFGGVPNAYISKETFEKYKSMYSFPKKGDILISAAGTIGRTVIYDGEPAYYQDSNIVWIDNDETIVLNSYLYYVYQLSPWQISTGGTIARLYNDNIANAKINIPPIKEQERIVSILECFDKLCNDISKGLPAEIEARQKQYEYYRDKLLSFEETP
jgi:type I restriction enzyme S subunit